MEEEGDHPPQQRPQLARGYEVRGGTSSRPRASYVRILRAEEGKEPPERQPSHIGHGTPVREGAESPNQEKEDGAPT